MPYTFTVNLSGNTNNTLLKVAEDITNNGGMFTVDGTVGVFSVSGVHGSYQILGNQVIITVTKKPFIVSMATVEDKIIDYFTSR